MDVARVDHQHLLPPLGGLGLVEEPQLARHRARVEETGADRHHHVQVARLDQLPAHLRFLAARRRRLRGHDEPGPAGVVQVAVEVGDPEVVAVGDLALLVHARKGIRQARVVLYFLRVHLVDVERRIGHDEVALAEQLVRVLVVGDGLVDVTFEAVHGEVHVGEADRRRVLLHAEEGRPFGRVEVHAFDEVRALHEHPARAAGRVEHAAVVRLDDVDDGLDQRDGCEELAAVMRLLVGELGEKVLVDAPEHVAVRAPQGRVVEGAQKLAEHVVVEFLVLGLGQGAAQGLVVLLDLLHRIDHHLRAISAVRQGDEIVELRFRLQEDGALPGEVLLGECAWPAPARRQRGLDLGLDLEEAAVGVAQEDQPHDGQEILVAGEVGVGTQVVRAGPEPFLDRAKVFQPCVSCSDSRIRQSAGPAHL